MNSEIKRIPVSDRLIPVLKTLGFVEITKEELRQFNCKEIIEYWDGGTWKCYGIK